MSRTVVYRPSRIIDMMLRTHVGVLVGGVVRAAVGVAVAAPAGGDAEPAARAPELPRAARRVVRYSIVNCLVLHFSSKT